MLKSGPALGQDFQVTPTDVCICRALGTVAVSPRSFKNNGASGSWRHSCVTWLGTEWWGIEIVSKAPLVILMSSRVNHCCRPRTKLPSLYAKEGGLQVCVDPLNCQAEPGAAGKAAVWVYLSSFLRGAAVCVNPGSFLRGAAVCVNPGSFLRGSVYFVVLFLFFLCHYFINVHHNMTLSRSLPSLRIFLSIFELICWVKG